MYRGWYKCTKKRTTVSYVRKSVPRLTQMYQKTHNRLVCSTVWLEPCSKTDTTVSMCTVWLEPAVLLNARPSWNGPLCSAVWGKIRQICVLKGLGRWPFWKKFSLWRTACGVKVSRWAGYRDFFCTIWAEWLAGGNNLSFASSLVMEVVRRYRLRGILVFRWCYIY